MKSTARMIGLVAGLMAISACGSTSAPQGDPALGEEIYLSSQEDDPYNRACAGCHRLDSFETIGPAFEGLGERSALRVEGMGAYEYLRESIVDPEAFLVEGFTKFPMPTFYGDILTEEDINNLIAFMLSQ